MIGLPQPACQAHQFRAVVERSVGGRPEREGHHAGQTCQREDVDRVVVKDGYQSKCFLGAQVFEVDVGDQFAGYVALSLDAEDLALERVYDGMVVEFGRKSD